MIDRTMFRILLCFIAAVWMATDVVVSGALAQEPSSGVEAAAAIEKTLVDVIARGEKSVVAIARVRREQGGETFRLE
ncbi:MAG: hypothetical protein ABSA77_08120, partial [Thermoguttaceae bacterium]